MRNTYDSKIPFNKGTNPNQQSKDRDTYTSVNPKQLSYQKQAPSTAVSNKEKMQKFILQTLKKLSLNNENKFVALTALKANQKTLLSTISNLLTSFDNSFQEQNINIDMLPDLFRVLGYPNTINKTYFQPVGAPHTWSQCLTMMDWLAQLAAFHYDIRNHMEQGEFEPDFTTMLISAYLQQTPEIPRKHLQNEINRKLKSIEDHCYAIQTQQLSIENLKAAQKDLSVMQEQKKRFQSILNRQKQETIQVNQQNTEMIKKLQYLEAKLEQERKISHIRQRQILSLKNQIQNQQLSVEQVERIRFQIKDYHDKIIEVKKNHEQQKEYLDKIDTNIVNEYVDFNKTLDILRTLVRTYRYEIQRRNTYFHIPDCNTADFATFLKDRKSECTDSKIQQILGTKEIKQIRDKASILESLIHMELKNFQCSKEQVGEQNRKANEECLQKLLRTKELQQSCENASVKLNSKRKQNFEVQMKNQRIMSEIVLLDKQLGQSITEQQNRIKRTAQLTRQTKEAIDFKKVYEKKVNQSIEDKQRIFDEYQVQCLLSMEEYYNSFIELNEYVDQVDYVQDQFNQIDEGKQSVNRRKSMRFINQACSQSIQDEYPDHSEQQNQLNQGQIQQARYNLSPTLDQQLDYEDISQINRQYFMSPPQQRVNRMNNAGYRR